MRFNRRGRRENASAKQQSMQWRSSCVSSNHQFKFIQLNRFKSNQNWIHWFIYFTLCDHFSFICRNLHRFNGHLPNFRIDFICVSVLHCEENFSHPVTNRSLVKRWSEWHDGRAQYIFECAILGSVQPVTNVYIFDSVLQFTQCATQQLIIQFIFVFLGCSVPFVSLYRNSIHSVWMLSKLISDKMCGVLRVFARTHFLSSLRQRVWVRIWKIAAPPSN